MIRQLLFAVAAISIGLTLAGCAAKPPMPLDQYLQLRDGAKDHMRLVEQYSCARMDALDLCKSNRALREQLKVVDAKMIEGYSKQNLSEEEWTRYLGIVTSIVSGFLGIPGR